MPDLEFYRALSVPSPAKIVMLIMDGLGGLPRHEDGSTELESAHRPNLNELALQSALGLSDPVAAGVTPGSGPGHLGLFGYDPLKYEIGRGVLEGLGIDFALGPDDVAARGNFASLDAEGNLTDRRAGRISTETNRELVQLLRGIKLPGVETFVETVKEHRFVLVLRGKGLGDLVPDTDPGRLGLPPLSAHGEDGPSEKTAALVNEFVSKARTILRDKNPANCILLRGFAKRPKLPTLQEIYGIRAAAVAVYPMYKGVAKLVGMTALEVNGETIADEVTTLEQYWNDFDFFYFHVKKTDSYGEDGNFDAKVQVIEEVDRHLPAILALNPEVVVISGDHSTPAVLRAHSWHPVPTLLYSKNVRAGKSSQYGERACAWGMLGRFPAKDLMPLIAANALLLNKFGA